MKNKLKYIIEKSRVVIRTEGYKSLFIRAKNLAIKILKNEKYYYDKFSFVAEVDFSKPTPLLEDGAKIDKNHLKMNWIIPDFSIGSGGHINIFRNIKFMEEFGHDCEVYIVNKTQFHTEENARKVVTEHFSDIKAKVKIGLDEFRDCDAAFATSWETAYPLYNAKNARKKFYFVQDFEPYFFPLSSEYVFAENTYKMGYHLIGASKWLDKKLKEYSDKVDFFELAYDPEVYKPNKEEKKTETQKILFYARYVTPRRGFDLGIEALKIVKKACPEVEIDFIGWKEYPFDIPFEYTNKGIMTHQVLADLYRESTIGLPISLTNYSILPQEMMACGLPVVDVKRDNTTSIYGKNNQFVTLAEADPISLAASIIELLISEEKRQKMIKGGFEFVKGLSWEKSAREIEAAVKKTF